jgi:peptidoglycan/LPS O-acetylase OafA/YrhL
MNLSSGNDHLVPERQQYPALNGVRGFAFLLVLLAHFSNHYGGPFAGLGKVGVWIFFVLSAFLLTRQFLEAPLKAFSRYGLVNYACRRFFRIVPLYVLILFIYLPFQYVVTNSNLLDHLMFQQGRGHLWTVIAELQYYFLIPLISFGFLKLLKLPRAVSIVVLLALWLASIAVFPPFSFGLNTTSVAAYLCVFLAGSIAAFLSISVGALKSRCQADVVAYPMFALVGVGLITSATRDDSWTARLFSSAPLQFLGQISFSGYLIHPLLLKLTSRYAQTMGAPTAVFISAAAVLMTSCILYIAIERPLSKLRLRPTRTLLPVSS